MSDGDAAAGDPLAALEAVDHDLDRHRANRLASIRLLTWLEQEIQILMLEHVQSAVQAFGFAWYLREPCLKIHNGFLSGRSYQDLVLKGEIL